MAGIPSDQVMAIMRLKQWAFERTAIRQGNTGRLKRSGWRERRMRENDSRQVRVLDFERALSQLDPIELTKPFLSSHVLKRVCPPVHM